MSDALAYCSRNEKFDMLSSAEKYKDDGIDELGWSQITIGGLRSMLFCNYTKDVGCRMGYGDCDVGAVAMWAWSARSRCDDG